MNAPRSLAALAVVVFATGCATTNQKYNWGGYSPALYGYYKDPTRLPELANALDAIIKGADAANARVPPGIYAEYGYLQLQRGNTQDAIKLFKQEQALWPEARVFMDHMVQVASVPVSGSNNPSP